MSITHAKNQRGFTLIEMSIVLVIIGLIIGGILKGQELIESARQKNVVSQIDSVRAQVNTFQDRFKSLPGDYGAAAANINANLVGGNDDGVISSAVALAYPATAATLAAAHKDTGEEMQFFNMLVAANMLGGASVESTTTATNFAGGAAVSAIPAAAYPQTGLSLIYGKHPGNDTTLDGKTQHWLVVSRFGTNLVQVAQTTGATSAQRAYQLDLKYDDGLPDSGSIRTFGLTAHCGAPATDAYTPTATGQECELVFALQ